ncbi:hypothetical protein [Phycisphaera mikurensis]|uniref:Chromosome partition protein Smc n=1 Tax=Phycisphaera mikurensis (strain NBRC 102666 / KCTC 22515 / FYK2301M01) TaxID=1142394 RepID=I0ID69_PHYMF|nr:hypothetical protein [Phycisphaera mikurensis]MBB6442332.1 putative nucleic acid-binding Zn-ribbon protein [Phycisphaera mikurensis]BAM03207.1 hypothetical protein PSMK_10480 [Phycisphaera mikurensis NBRC 102666]
MSPLTKAFVVLVTLLSILLVTLVVPFVAGVSDLQQELTIEQQKSRSAEVTASNLSDRLVAAESAQAGLQQSLNETISDLESRNAEVAAERNDLRARLAAAQTGQQEMQATLAALSENDRTKTQLLDTYAGKLEEAQQSLVEQSRRNAELTDRTNELSNERTQLTRSVQRLKERSTELSEQLAAASSALASAGVEVPEAAASGLAAAPVPAGERIFGQVTGIEDATGGRVLVQMNIGASDGVRNGQRFVAFRGDDQLVGTLEVRSVDDTVSVASVVSQQQPLRPSDSIVSADGIF